MAENRFGVIAPHPPIMVAEVGGSRAKVTEDSLASLDEAARALAAYAPETLLVMSPHAPAVADAIALDDADRYEGSLSQFGDGSHREWSGDRAFSLALLAELDRRGVPTIARSSDSRLRSGWLDHGVIVPLSFLDPQRTYALSVVSLSYLPYGEHRVIGEAAAAAAAATGRKVAFVASGDLSHRLTPDAPAGYSPEAAELDKTIAALVEHGEFEQLSRIDPSLIEAGGECGLRSFIALGGFLGSDPVPTRVLSYEGPWGVGYLTALAGQAALDAAERHALTADRGRKGGMAGEDESQVVALARRAIEVRVRAGEPLEDARLTDASYPRRAGAFVSLHRDGSLRGCIGTILPTRDSLAEEVAANAVEAALHDPRFPPLNPDELDDLEIKVDVLHEPNACNIEDLDPARYGVITSSGWRRGLLLPDLEGVDDVETQVAIAMQKAGIQPGEPCSYERFKVDRYT